MTKFLRFLQLWFYVIAGFLTLAAVAILIIAPFVLGANGHPIAACILTFADITAFIAAVATGQE